MSVVSVINYLSGGATAPLDKYGLARLLRVLDLTDLDLIAAEVAPAL